MTLLYIYTKTADKSLLRKAPQPFRDCIEQCVQLNPADRFQSIQKVWDFLKRKKLEKRASIAFWILFPIIIFILSAIFSSPETIDYSAAIPVEDEAKITVQPFYIQIILFIAVGGLSWLANWMYARHKRKKNTINR